MIGCVLEQYLPNDKAVDGYDRNVTFRKPSLVCIVLLLESLRPLSTGNPAVDIVSSTRADFTKAVSINSIPHLCILPAALPEHHNGVQPEGEECSLEPHHLTPLRPRIPKLYGQNS